MNDFLGPVWRKGKETPETEKGKDRGIEIKRENKGESEIETSETNYIYEATTGDRKDIKIHENLEREVSR